MIRPAEQHDRLAIGQVYAAAWKAAYRGIVPDAFLDSLTGENCAPVRPISGKNTLVYESGGLTAGVAHFGPGRNENSAMGELYSLYVLPQCWHCGAGSALFNGVLRRICEMQLNGLYLWTLRDNLRARAFYEKMGMRFSGEARMISIGGTEIPEVKYLYTGTIET